MNRIHIGMESGADAVLKKVKKGTDKATQVLAGQKIKRAGMELSEYYMPGIGGRNLWRENAVETADALNQINPDFIRLRTLALPEGTRLMLMSPVPSTTSPSGATSTRSATVTAPKGAPSRASQK